MVVLVAVVPGSVSGAGGRRRRASRRARRATGRRLLARRLAASSRSQRVPTISFCGRSPIASFAIGRISRLAEPAVGGVVRSGAPNVTPSGASDGSTCGSTTTGRIGAPPRTWIVFTPGFTTSERWNPDDTWSGSISAIAPLVRALANVRKWSLTFGARRQIESTVERLLRTDFT